MGLIKMAAAGAAGYALYKYANRHKDDNVAYAGGDDNFTKVRDAGPEHMQTPPSKWSRTDETLDESFPASDPPSTY